MLWFLTNFAPLRWLSSLLIGIANVVLPGQGPEAGPVRHRGGDPHDGRRRRRARTPSRREERRLIHSIFEFGDTVVREVMLPRPDMVAVDADDTIEEAIERAIERGFSRLPGLRGHSTDEIIGLVYLKDLVASRPCGRRRQHGPGGGRPAIFVPEQKRVAELLREMRTKQFHMAIVVDEHGGTAGLVTLEDLLEEIVGEIADEYDVEMPVVERLADGSLRVPGRTPIDEVSEALGTELPDEEWDTVGGLILNLLGHVPDEGETVRFQGLEFRTERVQGHRIASVRITRFADAESDEPDVVVDEDAKRTTAT